MDFQGLKSTCNYLDALILYYCSFQGDTSVVVPFFSYVRFHIFI